jgi:hypothetical protein
MPGIDPSLYPKAVPSGSSTQMMPLDATTDFNPLTGGGGGYNFSGAFDGATAPTSTAPTDYNPLIGAGIGALGTLMDPATAQTKTTDVRLPDYIAPYAGRILNRAEAASNEGYIPYGGQRLQDFNADQQTAFQNTRDMQAMSPQQTQGGGIVGQAATNLMNGGSRSWDQDAADKYMNPYQQNVIDIQKREAQRDYDKQMPVLDAAAVKAGAFGGDRQAILQSEAQRNLNQRLGDIQTTGTQQAYNNAQSTFNTDMSRQNQANQGAVYGGQTLAGIGQQGFQNQLAVNQGIMGIGNQQQQLGQQGLNVGYQNFQDQLNDPMKKIGYMQQGMQGLPMNQVSTANTTPPPSLTQQLISNGIGGYMMGGGH